MYTQENLIKAIETFGYYQAPEYIKSVFNIEITKEKLDIALKISNERYILTLNSKV